jgi:hypothetical protein
MDPGPADPAQPTAQGNPNRRIELPLSRQPPAKNRRTESFTISVCSSEMPG